MFLNKMDTRYTGEPVPSTSYQDPDLVDLRSRNSSDSQSSEPRPVPYAETHIITVQPKLSEATRRPIPISTVDWRTNSDPQIMPFSGVDFLKNVPEVIIQQTVEMSDILSHVESENRFVIKYPAGESIYVAKESSHWMQRAFLGSCRGFSMAVIDQSQQVAFLLERRSAPIVCCCSCALQQMKVYHPSGVTIGTIIQECSWSTPRFLVYDLADNLMYRIVGPSTMVCASYVEKTFTIYSSDGLHELSNISHTYNDVLRDYQLVVTFPQSYTEALLKSLIVGAAFLLQYMFFEQPKRASIFKRFQGRTN